MTEFIWYDTFSEDVGRGFHNLHADTIKVAFSDRAPDIAADRSLADIVEIAAGNGYPAGGFTLVGTSWIQTAGIASLTGSDISFSSNTGDVGPFRYLVLYNSTASGGPLIAYWDRGASITLDGTISEPFTQHFYDLSAIFRFGKGIIQ